MIKVIGIGSVFVDHFFLTDKTFLKKLGLKPEDDVLFEEENLNPELISRELELLSISPGGNTFNTLAVLTKLGTKTKLLATIGADNLGNFFTKNNYSVDLNSLSIKGTTSICYCLLTDYGKQRTFLSKINPDDDHFLDFIDIGELDKSTAIFLGPVIGNARKSIKKIADIIYKLRNKNVFFSPGYIYSRRGLKELEPILRKTKVLFANKKEIQSLTGSNFNKALRILINYIGIIVCTLGDSGAIVATKDKILQSNSLRVSPDAIVDSTGAGDTFAAAFAYGVLNKKSLEYSANFANKTATKSLSGFGLNWLKVNKFN